MLNLAVRSLRGRTGMARRISSMADGTAKEKVDCVVIGAGVVGIAVARELSLRGRDVLVLESAPTFGTGTSSRNSEVIHAGIYYPRNSLKAVLCVRGRDLLYRYCSEHEIPHKQIGKLIVATRTSEVPKLNELLIRGVQNGVEGLRMVGGNEAMRMEPELQCVKALLSPLSGIVDSHSFMLSLVGEAENHGAKFSYNTAVIGGHVQENKIHLHISDSKNLEKMNEDHPPVPEFMLVPRLVVNSTGLSAVPLAKRFDGLHDGVIPPSYYARGCYFTLSNVGVSPFQRLIYPLPEDGGIGVHVTLDLDGQVKFGPDVEWIDEVDGISIFLNNDGFILPSCNTDSISLVSKFEFWFDYSVHSSRAERFYEEIRKYYPSLKDGSLQSGYAGIRPKLSGPRQTPADFVIQGEDIHKVSGLVNLFGIESPGLTSSLAIAEHIAAIYM